jgi:Fur family ferric uptake transcriptional regulator
MACETETIDLLRETGHKMTPQRMMVLTSLRHAPGHLSATAIYDSVKAAYPYVDISTIYRTLNVLKELGVVSETHMGGGDATFEWVGDERHHHLVCKKCNGVSPLNQDYMDRLGAQISQDFGFAADMDHFAIFGVCKGCGARELAAN